MYQTRIPEKEDRLEETAQASLTFVMLKQEGKWLIASVQNTPIQQQAIDNIKASNIQFAGQHFNNTSQ
ncbi:hypothetical protein [Paraflavitalea speifideaquila]|uniref:hypothetical protein n=1 Tax=Paraflavitalea speifideaquila TaxID=3076558 RepID=UPI0028E96C0E|nr:hypothetical protein [Paraflavitalea speifideiaquila]